VTVLIDKLYRFLNEAKHILRGVDRPSLAIAALAMGVFAQGSLTWSTELVAGTLIGIGILLLGTSVFDKSKGPASGQRLTTAVLLFLLIIGGLILKTLSSFKAAAPLYTVAVVLCILALGKQDKPTQSMREPYTKREFILLFLIVALGFSLQGYRVEQIPPGFHGDEAESGMQALELLHGQVNSLISVGWYHLPMMSFAWHALSMRIFGETVYGLRMSSVIVGTLTLIPFYFLTRLLFNRRTAIIATFLLAVSHPFIALNRLGINYTQTTLLEVTAFYFLFRGLRSRKWWDFAISGLFMGAGLYLYYASRLVPFIVIAFLFCAAIAHRGFLRTYWRGITVFWLAAILIFAPMGLYFIQNPWHLMSRTSHVFVLGDQGWVDTPYARNSPAVTLLNQAARILPLFNYGGDMSGQYGYRGPALDFITSILFILGLGYASVNSHRPRHFFLLIWFWSTLIVGGVLTLPAPFIPRLAGMLPVLSIFAAVVIVMMWDLFAQTWGSGRLPKATLRALLLVTLCAVAFLNYDTYFNQYLPTVQGWAMREPATAIARYITSLGEEYNVYLLGEPKLYIRHGTIRFIARDATGTDVLNPSQYIPLKYSQGKNAVYILLPSHLHHLPTIQQYYPRGTVRHFTRESGELWFTTFEISKEDIAAVRSSGASP
jgi:4-amino-4-deoxy-L-arabinose transferase-like glycosyltransferase